MSDPLAPIFNFLKPELKEGWNPPGLIAGFKRHLAALGVEAAREAAAASAQPLSNAQTPGGALAGATDSGGPIAPAIAMISAQLLKVAVPSSSLAELEPWVEPIKRACQRFEINTIRRVAAFIAQMAHESEMKPRSENLNYSVDGLLRTFGRHRISAADCQRYGRKPGQSANQEAIANCIYGGEYGRANLGNTQPGDGWLFRGGGPLQITGRSNWTRFAEAMGMRLEQALAYGRTLEGGIMAAAWFWEANDINRLADTPGVTDETRKINGGTNGLADRAARFDRLVAEMLKLEGRA
jgi:putative chitinase